MFSIPTFNVRSNRCCRLLRLGLSLAATVVALTGCGGGSDEGGAEPGGGNEEFGLTTEQLSQRIEQTEAAIAACMTKAGFHYVPLDSVSVRKAMSSDQSAPGLSEEDYVKRYGFGITTQFDRPIVAFGAGPQNQAILAALGASDQAAYRRQLWGDQPEWTLVRALELEELSQTEGCTKSALSQFFGAAEMSGSYVNPADTLIAADKRMVEAYKKWSQCMQKAGFTYTDPDAVERDLNERLQATTLGADPRKLTGDAQQALKALQAEELALAGASTKCFEDHVADVESKVEADLFRAGAK